VVLTVCSGAHKSAVKGPKGFEMVTSNFLNCELTHSHLGGNTYWEIALLQ